MLLASRPTGWLRLVLVAVVLVAGTALPVVAQQPPPPVRVIQDLPDGDFLFRRPRGLFSIRGGFLSPRENSDLFEFLRDQLTIDKGNFGSPSFAVDVGYSLTPRFDIVGGFDLARQTVDSEYRDFVDNNLLPIQQQTSLRQNSFTGTARFALLPRGRSVGTYAWIPTRVQPWVGAGGGIIFWEFAQAGDFVDFEDLEVFTDSFQSSGASLGGHVAGGVDIQMYKRLFLATEARYIWASGTLSNDFVGFDPIDLSGFRISAGINFVF